MKPIQPPEPSAHYSPFRKLPCNHRTFQLLGSVRMSRFRLYVCLVFALAGAPMAAPAAESPRPTYAWSAEEAFDPSLNPIRAKVSLGMRVLSVNDLGFEHRGSSLFLAYQQQKETLA